MLISICRAWVVAFATATLFYFSPAGAQTYPLRPIRMLVGWPPGGTADVMGRIVAQKLAERIGQQVIIDNRPGASGIIAADIVAKSQPDGYTLLMSGSPHSTNLSLYSKMPYDTVKDFAPIALVAITPYTVLVVHSSVAVNSVNELIAYLKTRPGKISFAVSGYGSAPHLAGELMKRTAGVDFQQISYKGTGALLPDLLSGRVPFAFETVAIMAPHIKSGTLRALAVTSTRRSPVLPDVPTMAEAGLPGLEVVRGWFGVFAAAQTPSGVVKRLNSEIAAIMKEPDIHDRLFAMGAEPVSGPPSDLRDVLVRDIEVLGKVIREAGIRID